MRYIRTYIFATIVIFLTACGSSSSTANTTTTSEDNTTSIPLQVENIVEVVRVACVGDSLTNGYRLDDPKTQSYPSQLATMLGDGWSVQNYGLTNTTLLQKGDDPYSQTTSFVESQASAPQIVVILLGSNDSKPINWKYKEDFIADYTAFIKSYQALESNPQIWIAYPTPAFSGMSGITDSIIKNEMIPLIDIISQNTGVAVIDLYTPLSNKKDLFPDTIHPNAEGATIIAQTVYSAIY